MIDQHWKVYSNRLRPNFGSRIVEIQTLRGETVIPWTAFDLLPHTKKLTLARHIVKVHNESLKDAEPL